MRLLQSVLVLFAIMTVAHAEHASPFRSVAVKKVAKRSRLAKEERSGIPFTKKIAPLSFAVTLRSEGRVVVTLTTQREVAVHATFSRRGVESNDSQHVRLYQGEVSIRGIHYPAAASVVGNDIILTFPGRERGSRGTRQRVYTVTTPDIAAGKAVARVGSAPASFVHKKTCADHGQPGNPASAHGTTISSRSATSSGARLARVVTLSTVADPALYARWGSQTNAYIAGIVNAAEVLFERQLGIRFQIVRQHVYTDSESISMTKTEPYALLQEFAANANNSASMGTGVGNFDEDVDVKHLFTGRDLDGAPIGIAYVGAVCYQPRYAYSLTQVDSREAAPYYFAHEVGHVLGARHDASGWSSMSVMSPFIQIGSSFSKKSIGEIQEHLTYFGACLEQKLMKPNLANAKVSITATLGKRSVKIAGSVLSSLQIPIAGARVAIVIGKRVVRTRTNTLGRFQVFTNSIRGKIPTKVFAMTDPGDARSRVISVRVT